MKILVPVDGSEYSLRAAEYAARMASQDPDLEVTLLAVVYPFMEKLHGRSAIFFEGVYNETIFNNVVEECRQNLEKARELFNATEARVETLIQYGDPAETIVQYTREQGIDQIVMGSRGMGAFKSMLLGSVSYKVLSKAPVPVTIIK